MTIGKKYNCTKISNPKYSLELWYNDLIDKEEDNLSLTDICIMLRQSILKNIALPRGLEYLKMNPLAGDLFAGELLQVFFEYDKNFIIENKEIFENIIKNGWCILDQPYSYSMNNYHGLSFDEVSDLKQLMFKIKQL